MMRRIMSFWQRSLTKCSLRPPTIQAVSAAVVAGGGLALFSEFSSSLKTDSLFRPLFLNFAPRTLCQSDAQGTNNNDNNDVHWKDHSVTRLSWIRRSLAAVRLTTLPTPRVVGQHDPDLVLSARRRRERQKGEYQFRKILSKIHTALENGRKREIAQLSKQMHEILYGTGETPQTRQFFLEKFGCTGWTEEVLVHLLSLGSRRGFVEIGAGNGQWARVLNDRFQQARDNQDLDSRPPSQFEFCLAYDDNSALPLNPEIYHKRTQPCHDHFYDKVQHCDSITRVLRQWQCRGRVLLLVFPAPDEMAETALREYTSVSPLNDTVVYVGEGRGGANASDAFFDALEDGNWVLWKKLSVQPFGTKGFEQLFIFKRMNPHQSHESLS